MSRLSPIRREAEEREARRYVELIRGGPPHDWSVLNKDIIARYSFTALVRIKKRAWQIIDTESVR
jgi:hypothetical protein